ncbi:vesicular glutamate transporter 1-like [Stegodyphus dumicola]|uniref:vesicular glutamate transporter 1-like n=1 Tax=Stegodyphus dumicola TaxID=202533 RepID=UPI0015AC0C6C|nr:vesicular glutamate transporter 1-like [Stegodyphus dumicola]
MKSYTEWKSFIIHECRFFPPFVEGYLPARYVLTLLLFWAMSLEFAHRVCLSVTIVAMVNHTAFIQGNDSQVDDSCPEPWIGNTTTPDPPGEYIWSPSIQGLILGAYFYGFVCTQLVGGRLAEVAGGKWPLGLSILFGSLLTFLTPIAADIGVVAIVLVRVAMGLIHGVCLPTAFAMFAHWAPVEERSTLLALCIMGDHVGTVLSMPLAGYLCENGFAGGWPSVFYVLGILGCIWFIFWCCLAYSKPADHPRVSKEEVDYILKGQIQIGEYQKLPVPWKQILCSPPVWSIAIVTFCAAWGHTTLLTKLPTYLELVLHVPIQKNGVVNSLIYVCICITLFLSGFASDYLRSKKNFNPTTVRKGFQLIAMMGPAITTALIPVVGCDKNSAIALLTLAMAFLGFCGGGHVSIAVEMAPHYAVLPLLSKLCLKELATCNILNIVDDCEYPNEILIGAGCNWKTHDRWPSNGLEEGVFEEVAKNDQGQVLYLSHREVIKENSTTKLRPVTILRPKFAYNCRSEQIDRKHGNLNYDEMFEDERLLIKMVQKDCFVDEKDEKLKPLGVVKDESGILRLKTKFTFCEDTEEFKMSAILPSNHEVVKRLVRYYHKKNAHAGTEVLINILRERFWILNVCKTVRSLINHCTVCRRFSAKKPRNLYCTSSRRYTTRSSYIFLTEKVGYETRKYFASDDVREPQIQKSRAGRTIKHASIEQWRLVFYISSGFYMFGGIIFVLWASAERQSWAYHPTMPNLLKIHSTGKESELFINKVDFERSFTYGTIS